MKTLHVFALWVLGLLFGVTIYLYPQLPEVMVTHWGVTGEPNGWMGRGYAAFLLPILTLLIYLGLAYLPRIDPLEPNYTAFRKPYELFVATFVLLFAVLHGVMLATALGYSVPMERVVVPGIGVLFVVIGNMLRFAKQNWFVGIRTPWTMSSEAVWNETHRMGAKLFVLAGIIMMGTAFLDPRVTFMVMLMVIFAIVFGTVGYSYILYRKTRP